KYVAKDLQKAQSVWAASFAKSLRRLIQGLMKPSRHDGLPLARSSSNSATPGTARPVTSRLNRLASAQAGLLRVHRLSSLDARPAPRVTIRLSWIWISRQTCSYTAFGSATSRRRYASKALAIGVHRRYCF